MSLASLTNARGESSYVRSVGCNSREWLCDECQRRPAGSSNFPGVFGFGGLPLFAAALVVGAAPLFGSLEDAGVVDVSLPNFARELALASGATSGW